MEKDYVWTTENDILVAAKLFHGEVFIYSF